MRRLILLTLLLLALAGGLAADALMAARRAMPPLPPAPAAGHARPMATLDLAGLTAAGAGEIVGWMAEDGVEIVRLRLPWNEIEPQPAQWRWDVAAGAVAAAGGAGLEVVLLLDGAPAWAVEPEDRANPFAPPHDVRDFGRFAAAAAALFGEVVDVYQIWDEPNIAPHWGAGWADPRGYFTLLREAANSLAAADPGAEIMLAALAPTRGDGAANLSDLAYLEALYELGAKEWFDIAAAQAYGFDRSPEAPPSLEQLNFRRPELLRQIMLAQGDGGAPLWITAWGWWAADGVSPDADSPWGAIAAGQLPDYVEQATAWAALRWPWAGPMAWAEYALTPGKDPRRAGFALRDDGGARTAAGQALRAAPPPRGVLGTGSHPAGSDAARITAGAWRFSPAAADPAVPGSELAITFQGRAVAVEVQRGFYWATLTARIDGQPAPLLPRDAEGEAYIALHDPANGVALVPLARDLAPGRHELRLRASAGWGQWLLRRLIVDHEPWPAPWPTLPLAALLLLGLAGTGRAWWAAWTSPAGRAGRHRLAARWGAAAERTHEWHGRTLALGLLLALLFYVAPGLPLSLLALLPLAALLALRPDLAPPLALAALPFYLQPKSLGPVGLPLHELILWLAAAFWLLQRLLLSRRPHPIADSRLQMADSRWQMADWAIRDPIDLALALLLVAGLFATLSAARFGFALYDYRTVFVTPTLFYLLASRPAPLSGRYAGVLRLSDALVLGSFLLALAGLGQLLAGRVAYAEGVPRLNAVYGSANNLALYLGRVLPLLLAVAVLGRPPRRWLYGLALLPVAAVAFLTFSKGLLLVSLPLGLLALAVLAPRLRRPAAALLLLGLLALLPFLGTERFTDLANTSGGTTFLRLRLWQSAWRMWLDHPWLGVGPDNFLYAYRSTYVLPAAWEELSLSHPHNLLLDLLTRTGLFGFLAGMGLLLATLRRGYAMIRDRLALSDERAVAGLGLYAGLVAGLGHGLIDNSIFLPDLAILTLLVAAVVRRAASH